MRHREWFQMALEAAQVGTWSWDPATDEMAWSDQASSLFGISKNAFGDTYEAFLDLVHPEDRDAVAQCIEATLHGSLDRYKIEHRIVRPDGDVRWVENRGQMIQAADQPAHLAGTVADVTERKERERAARESEAYRRKLYHVTSDPDLTDEEKVQRLLALGCERIGVENGFVSHIDEATGHYEIQMAYGSDYIQEGAELDLSMMYCERTITSDDILGIYNAAEEGWADHPSYKLLHVGCYMGGKILVDNDLYGTLCFVNREPREEPFTHDEKAFVDLMSRWMSHVFERRKHIRYLQIKHRAMEAAPVGITITNPKQDGYPIVYVNEKFQQLTGYTADECLGRNHRFLQGEETDPDQVETLRAAIDAKQPATVELLNYRKDGTAFWNRMSIAPVLDEAGEVIHFVGFQEDVTERKEAERQLSEREQRLQRYKQYTDDILNAIDDLLYVSDETGALLRWNETLPVVTGYSDEKIASMPALEIFAEDDRDAVRAAIEEVIQTGSGRVEAHLTTKEGASLPYEFAAGALEDPDGNQVLAGIGRDISARQEHDRELRAREQQLARYKAHTDDILNAIDDVFYVIDREGNLQRWNESLSDATGYSAEEIASMHALDFFGEADQASIADAIEEVFETGETRMEASYLTKDGSFVPYEFVAARLEDLDGNLVLAGIGRNITERKEAERELARLIDNVPGYVYRLSAFPEWKAEFFSEGVRDIAGYDAEALERGDVNWNDDVIAEGNEALEAQVLAALDDHEPFFLTYPIETADGERRWVKQQGRGVYAPDGSVEAVEGIVIDVTEQVEYEQELKRTTALLQRIQRIAQVGGWELDMRSDPPTSMWTEELYRLHDLPRDAAINLDAIINCYHPADRQRVRQVVESSLANGTGYDIEARMVTGPDGLRWVRAISDAVSENGELVAFRGAIQDITDRKRYEERLRESKEYAEGLIASMQDGFSVFNTELRQVQVNEALCRMTGFSPEELIGAEPPYPYWPPEELETIQSEFGKMLEGQQLENLELVFRRKNGERFPVIVAPSTLTDETGEVVNYFSTMKDITERKRAEEALRASEAHFRALVENAPVIFFATDREGVFTVSEGRQLTRLGLEPGEVVGQSVFDVYADVSTIVENIRRVLGGEERTWRVVVDDRVFDSYGTPLRDKNGEVTGVIGVATDVTERTRVARENARLVEDLRAMSVRLLETQEQERRRIARELHDEAGALLTSLQMCLDTAHQHIPAETNDDASVAREELEEAQELTGTLSAQIRQMALDLRPSVLDDLGLAAALQWLADQHARHTGLTVHLYHELGERQRFAGAVETAAYRIVQEALTNASRYADIEEVQVMVNVLEGQLRVHVIDEGRGFDLERVQQESETVGLSSMRERAELLQGELEIATAPGEGTRISATLPVRTSG